tara:strand:- start:507 stop:791 length:285 start_codon:yes stop_codon:yes gene_type:complete
MKEITKGRDRSRILPPVEFEAALSIDSTDEEDDEEDTDEDLYFPLRLCHVVISVIDKIKLGEYLQGYCVDDECTDLTNSKYDKFVKNRIVLLQL